MSSRVRQLAFAAGTAVIATAAALSIAEIGLRLMRYEFGMYPAAVQFGWPDPATMEQRYQLDRDLLWVPKDYGATLERWSGRRPTVAHLGDSCTEFGRYDEYLEALVENRGPALPGRGYSFVNLGVGGWSSYQGLVQMRRDVVRIRPDIATIYFGWNDHWRSYGVEDRDMGAFLRSTPGWMITLSRFRLAQLVMQARLARHRRAVEAEAQSPERVSLQDFESNLASMVRIARESGIVPVLLTAPTSHQVGREPAYLVPRWLYDLNRLVPLHLEYVEVVREVSREHDVHLVDLHAEFASMDVAERDGYFNEDGIHLNDRGNEKIAEILYDHFLRHDLLESSTSPVPT